MKKLFTILTVLSIAFCAFADDVIIPTTYQTNGEVTSSNLNGNFQALATKINGGLDNDNIDTTSGYRLYEVRSSFPSVKTQGSLVFVTSDMTLYVYDGSNWLAVGP